MKSQFEHLKEDGGDTIAAIATPPGEGGVAIIRISGKEALSIGDQIFSGPVLTYPTHTAHLGNVVSPTGNTIDQAMCLVMRAPKSYTGEDTIEIQCHGGSLVAREVLTIALQAGARAAAPGEFTLRAFLNGKIDLSQAEAIQEMIHAKNKVALEAAKNQLEGSLSLKIKALQKQLIDVAAILEAWVDFPEEGLEFATTEEILAQLILISQEMEYLLSTFYRGRKIRTGISLCLLGPPNAGKSSVMNALLGKDRAIVTPVAGTTRDLLEEELLIGGLHFRLIDTAGLRSTEEIVEKEGIARSLLAMKEADFVLLVLDHTEWFDPLAFPFLKECPLEKTLLLWNKCDLQGAPQTFSLPHTLFLSAKTDLGFDRLYLTLESLLFHPGASSKEEIILTQERHHQALQFAHTDLLQVMTGLKTGISAEFITADLKSALLHLGTIIGSNVTEEILGAIFSKFCVGK